MGSEEIVEKKMVLSLKLTGKKKNLRLQCLHIVGIITFRLGKRNV